MSILYKVYSNGGSGGPVNYTKAIAQVSGLSYAFGSLSPGSDNTFVVHTFDSSTNLEESSSETRVRIVVDAKGNDVSAVPVPVQSISLVPILGGGCRVAWSYFANGSTGIPISFLVNLTQGGKLINTTNVAYIQGALGYSCVINGPLAPSSYIASVISMGAGGFGSAARTAAGTLGIVQNPFVIDSLTIQT